MNNLIKKQSRYFAIFFIIVFILMLLLFVDKSMLTSIRNVFWRKQYMSFLETFSVEHPGRGMMDYPGGTNADYAKSYAMFLSAELVRAHSASHFQLSERARNAGYWLLNNADVDQDGIIGWGLPVAWDAYGDGTENPPDTIYTITTAIAINGLLDWLDLDPNAPADRIVMTVDKAIEPFLQPEIASPAGLIAYSFSKNDHGYDTYNPAAYMAGQMQRFSTIIQDLDKRHQIQEVADRVMASLLSKKLLDQNGGWYWMYGIGESYPNDMAHAIYIVDGIYQYSIHDGKLAPEFDWLAVTKHLDLFYISETQSWARLPQVDFVTSKEPPRLYGLGMMMRYVGLMGLKEESSSLYHFVQKYRMPNGTYAKYPIGEYGEENPIVINEYMSYLLYGWSSILYLYNDIGKQLQTDVGMARPESLPTTDLAQPILVPFTYLDSQHYSINLEFN